MSIILYTYIYFRSLSFFSLPVLSVRNYGKRQYVSITQFYATKKHQFIRMWEDKEGVAAGQCFLSSSDQAHFNFTGWNLRKFAVSRKKCSREWRKKVSVFVPFFRQQHKSKSVFVCYSFLLRTAFAVIILHYMRTWRNSGNCCIDREKKAWSRGFLQWRAQTQCTEGGTKEKKLQVHPTRANVLY